MDIFYEQIIKKTKKTSDILLISGALILSVLLTASIIFLFLCGITFWGFFLFFIFIIWWLFAKLIGNYNLEYEYTITNHEFDIDIIKGKKQRKHITTINLKKAEYFGNTKNPQTVLEMKKSAEISADFIFYDKRSLYAFAKGTISGSP